MKTLIKQEKGIAMVITLMLILVMSVMVAGFMLTITTEQKLGSNQLRYIEALNLAEAGISEVATRLDLSVSSSSFIGEYGFNPSSPSWEGRVLNATNLPSPPLGSSIIYYSTLLAGTAQQLPYTVSDITSPDSGYILTVKYKTNSAGTGIYYYDFSTGQEVLVTGAPYSSPSKYACPIWVVRSTGMVGNVRRTIEVELTKNKIDVNITAAVASDAGVYSTGAFSVCGHNHPMATPLWTRIMVGGSTYPCMDEGWELCERTAITCGQAGCLPGITTTDDPNEPPLGGGTETGYPVGNSTDGTFMDLWDVLSCGDETKMRDTYNITTISDPNDILAYYQTHDYFGFVEYTGDIGKTGSSATELNLSYFPDSSCGILWVRGPFNAVGDKGFKGIIFIEGEFVTSDMFWMLGAMLVRGDTTNYDRVTGTVAYPGRGMHFRGNADLLYSGETIQYILQQLLNEPAGLKQLTWREVNL